MSIFRNVVLNLKTEEECDRVIGLYKKRLESLENEGLLDVYICRLSKDAVLFFLTIDNDENAQTIFETMRAFREQQNLDLIDILVLDGQVEWHKNFSISKWVSMTRTFTLIFLFAWALMIVGYLLGVLEVPPTILLVNLIFG